MIAAFAYLYALSVYFPKEKGTFFGKALDIDGRKCYDYYVILYCEEGRTLLMKHYETDFIKFHILKLLRDITLLTMCILSFITPIKVRSAGVLSHSFPELLTDTFDLFFEPYADFLAVNWLVLITTLVVVFAAVLLIIRIIKAIVAFIDWDIYAIRTYDAAAENPRRVFSRNFFITTLLFLAFIAFAVAIFTGMLSVRGINMLAFIAHFVFVIITNAMMHYVAHSVKLQVVYDRFCR